MSKSVEIISHLVKIQQLVDISGNEPLSLLVSKEINAISEIVGQIMKEENEEADNDR